MPITTFRLIYREESLPVDLPALRLMLPSPMTVLQRDGASYIEIETAKEEDAGAQFHIDRELDRLFFLTSVRLKAEMCKRVVSAKFTMAWSIQGAIPSGTKPLKWSYAIGVQLRLWSLAFDTEDPLARIVLLFQIIELSRPVYEAYDDSTKSPDHLTECKLVRHLVVHAGDVSKPELKRYCAYLNLPPVMLDRTDSAYVEVIAGKCKLVEEQAKRVLQNAL